MTDERLTSWEAAKHAPARSSNLGNRGKPGKRVTRDDVAAAIILRDYLASRPADRKRPTAPRAKN
jgi:RNase H-fold protein (predicted Holliday junction resolvase)